MTDSGPRPNGGSADSNRLARDWLRMLLDRWDTDPTLVQSLSREEVLRELDALDDDAGDGIRENVRALQAWAEAATEQATGAQETAAQETAAQETAAPGPSRSRSPSAGGARRDRSPQGTSQSSSRLRLASAPAVRWAASAVAILIVAYGLLWGVGQASQPQVYALASLDAHAEQVASLTSVPPPPLTKDAASLSASVYRADVRAGATLLGSAHTTTLGLFPRYRDADVALGIAALERAYANAPPQASNSPSAGSVAFLIGKGYLMLDAPAGARPWLQRALDHADTTWHADAKRLLNTLPSL